MNCNLNNDINIINIYNNHYLQIIYLQRFTRKCYKRITK